MLRCNVGTGTVRTRPDHFSQLGTDLMCVLVLRLNSARLVLYSCDFLNSIYLDVNLSCSVATCSKFDKTRAFPDCYKVGLKISFPMCFTQ